MEYCLPFFRIIFKHNILTLACLFQIATVASLSAQQDVVLSGTLIDQNYQQGIPYVNVLLNSESDSTVTAGAVSDTGGTFHFILKFEGKFRLRISSVGYKTIVRDVFISSNKNEDLGLIFMEEDEVVLKEVIINAERVKVKSHKDRTVFFMNERLVNRAANATEVLKLLPEIQVDLFHNIFLEGSKEIIFFVDGKERDRNYISQISSGKIDSIELITKPSSGYDPSVTGIIEISLKKDQKSGISGEFSTEIPLSSPEVYMQPFMNLNFSTPKWDLFASYNGSVNYFDLEEDLYRKSTINSKVEESRVKQLLRQKNWSHKVHYGLDFSPDSNNYFSLYGFINPFSQEHDGLLSLSAGKEEALGVFREDTDQNLSTFYSLFFKHTFTENKEMIIDLRSFQLDSKNTTEFWFEEESRRGSSDLSSTQESNYNNHKLRSEFISQGGENLNFKLGAEAKIGNLKNGMSSNFRYTERDLALFGDLEYKFSKLEIRGGLRIEDSQTELESGFKNSFLTWSPHALVFYKFNSKDNVRLSFKKHLERPAFFQLNPAVSNPDPLSSKKGNPGLTPEFHTNLSVEYFRKNKNNFISAALFYSEIKDRIGEWMSINESAEYKSVYYNSGKSLQYGLKSSGSLQVGNLGLNSYFRIFEQKITIDDFSMSYEEDSRQKIAFETNFSALLSLKNKLSISLMFNYNSKVERMQSSSYSDALYFIAVEKVLFRNYRVGLTSGLPLTKRFTYHGAEINQPDFSSRYEGNIELSDFPVWLKIGYRFDAGKKSEKPGHVLREVDDLPQKGFNL